MWRKNRRPPPEGSDCYGVDLNRNYYDHWGGVSGLGVEGGRERGREREREGERERGRGRERERERERAVSGLD